MSINQSGASSTRGPALYVPTSLDYTPTAPAPEFLDSVQLRGIQLPLSPAPEAWHRLGKSQPCTATLKLTYSSTVAAAAADDVSLTLDYGKLYRRIESDLAKHDTPRHQTASIAGIEYEEFKAEAAGQNPRITASIIASAAFDLLHDSALAQAQTVGTISNSHITGSEWTITADRCEVTLHLPKAILRASEGLKYRNVTAWGCPAEKSGAEQRTLIVIEEEFRIDGIRCYPVLGVNPHERLEKQAVIVSLVFTGAAHFARVLETYQEVTRAVAEKVDETSFLSVESLVAFIARIVTVDFGNEHVTVHAEKPSALAFVEGSGVEITRSRTFFQNEAR
ncbi:hypothetical protein N7468_004451 [Penicillium chermesinum]|uniref:dihydroneopterin aldolase n=1 Tax=Penicillium chermesinum TaxID=63820 RepID=A0A9W9PBG3_9EURO|nr:uncharacterized protein N7468_004451 [Penicillium chermesinum]KAJ5239832.1 hypothetical protein N7468_004451 [Penicillium chermesinum]